MCCFLYNHTNLMQKKFDAIIVGAGHAGLEAAFACAKLNLKTALITLNYEHIADTPCNPSIGGPAKGVVVREIDALGGMQAQAADCNQLQIKLLNTSRGAGVWALRAQIDKIKYHEWFCQQIRKQKNLTLIIDEVTDLIIKKKKIVGVKTKNHVFYCKGAVITTGTYLKSICHFGHKQFKSGPSFQKCAEKLSQSLAKNGFKLIRLKTGTPPRILNTSINYNKMQIQPGSKQPLAFVHYKPIYRAFKKQVPSYLIFTNKKIHDLIKRNIKRSAMYAGRIHAIGPRYCPSIEDKVIKFPHKPKHQLFIEPESLKMNTIYLQGFSTSFDEDFQEKIVHLLPGFARAKILKYAYAIEYDAIDPTQLKLNYEAKKINNLFFAGQINGTSGYEEAAGQGLLAGINLFLKIKKKSPLILSRQEAYIGVMTDDIITKGITEPYRLLTSRAEHRLYLRNDNAQERLLKYGYKVGLVSEKVMNDYKVQQNKIVKIINLLKSKYVGDFPSLRKKYNCPTNYNLFQLLKRPDVKLSYLLKFLKITANDIVSQKIEIQVKFEGYINNQLKNIKKLNNLTKVDLTKIKDYRDIKNLSLEAIDKLNRIMPEKLDQASRISGINLIDIAIIKNYVDHMKK